jgi:L-lactate dehydrogenase (cytochrome)
MRLRDCHNFHYFRRLAQRRLPGPLFDYIDGGADEEATHRRNTQAFERDPSANWDDVAEMVRHWDGQFCLKGVMSAADAKRAAEIGCTGIVISNHGGRQLDGSRASFDQLAEIADAVGDRIDVLMDGGVQRGTHVLKALSLGAKAVGVGRYYLYPLAVGGQAGVERALGLMQAELERDMKLMGCTAIGQLSRDNLRFR